MNYSRTFVLLLGLQTFVGLAAERSSVAVIERGSGYEITVPESRLILKFPTQGLKPSGQRPAGVNQRYFYLANNRTGFHVSGWFEPAKQFPGNKKYWNDIEKNRPKTQPPAQDVSFSKEGLWEIIWYSVVRDTGTQRNVHASHVEAGTWVDLHISIFPYQPERTQDIVGFLKSARLEAKP